MGWTAEESRFDSWKKQRISLFSKTSTPTLGPTQLPVQMKLRAVSPEVKRHGREADRSRLSSTEVKNGEGILPFSLTTSWRDA
jgi:hypothetical protein